MTPQATSSELLRVDSRELPDWAGRPETPTLLAFRYLRPGYHLSLVTRRFDPATVLQALVEEASLTTVVAEDGQMMTALAFAVRNNGRQFLELAVPPGAEVWSAFVAGQGRSTKPTRRQGAHPLGTIPRRRPDHRRGHLRRRHGLSSRARTRATRLAEPGSFRQERSLGAVRPRRLRLSAIRRNDGTRIGSGTHRRRVHAR